MSDVHRSPAAQLRARSRAEAVAPGTRARLPRGRLIRAYLLALVAPVATAIAVTPWRVDHGRTMAIILMVPVAVVATLGATGPGLVSAVVAGLAYDLLLAAPYNSFAIANPDETITMITLVSVGLLVGWLASRVVRLGAQTTSRDLELRHIIEFALSASSDSEPDTLIEAAGAHIAAVLDLESCTWTAGPFDGAEPRLLPDGSLMGPLVDLGTDRAQLPAECVMPVVTDDHRLGYFRLRPRPGTIVSMEERRTVTTIGQLLAAHLGPTAGA